MSDENFLQETADLVTFTAKSLMEDFIFCALKNLNNRKITQKSIIFDNLCQTICKF